MLEFVAGRLLVMIEQELEKHGPEIEQAILEQIEYLGLLIRDYVQSKINDETEQLEHNDADDKIG